MGLLDTPSGERIRIGFFGRRNTGKSSLVNAVTGQELSIVSEKKGTTTDPVRKAMELMDLGPVVIIDTPGYDDEGELGGMRVEKTKEILRGIDAAVLVIDGTVGMTDGDREYVRLFHERKVPYLLAANKADLKEAFCSDEPEQLPVSAKTGEGVKELKERLSAFGKAAEEQLPLVSDLVKPGDRVILVIPIDEAAPKGRLILPQQQVIRELLEAGAFALCTREIELPAALAALSEPPALVITDSQAFSQVAEVVPEEVPLTSFSILMARRKGVLDRQAACAEALDSLKDGDCVLVAEGCTHHRRCGDIGTVKIPAWLSSYTKKKLRIETASGNSFPRDLTRYALILHCGGCMLGAKEMQGRNRAAKEQNVPIVNYGMAIAKMNGVLKRALTPVKRRGNRERIRELAEKEDLPPEELKMLLTTLSEEEEAYLYQKASEVRERVFGKDVYLRGLIEFSNHCIRNCRYCGIRRDNCSIGRYRMTEEAILSCAENGYALGLRTIVLQSGEDPYYTDEMLCALIRRIKKNHSDTAVTLSIGEKPRESYEKYFAAGADRFLLRHETIDPEHFACLHPKGQTIRTRTDCLKALKEIGYQTGAGIMVGSPGQTWEHILKDLAFLKTFQPEMVGIGPFIPQKDTPFADRPAGSLADTLHLLAVIRLMLPHVLLPATTALGTIDPQGIEKGLLAGANVFMPNLTPEKMRSQYRLYDGKNAGRSDAEKACEEIRKRIGAIGMRVPVSRGDYRQ